MEVLTNTELFWYRAPQLLPRALQIPAPPPPTLQRFIADDTPHLQQNKALDEKYISGTSVSCLSISALLTSRDVPLGFPWMLQ